MVSVSSNGDVRLVRVDLGERSHPIYVGPGLIGRVGELLLKTVPRPHRCAVVTSDFVDEIHGDSLVGSLEDASLKADVIHVPDGEEAKSWGVAERVLGDLLDLGLDRGSVIIAFGGGAIGDLSGFVSAIYMRGVRLIQVPTTLLAQVDSGIGGKAAVNHPRGKNLIGAFHQPSLVVTDPGLLATLPREEFASGLAEVAKYGVIADAELFGILESMAVDLIRRNLTLLTEAIARCCAVKARFVEQDEGDEKGLRAALNYGHTVGHALEAMSNFRMRHGEAVAIGMDVASRISHRLGLIDEAEIVRQRALLKRIGLETGLPDLDRSELLESMRMDKKAEGGSIRFVLPTGIGRPPVLMTIPEEMIVRALEDGRSG